METLERLTLLLFCLTAAIWSALGAALILVILF